jgi:hypothetical protein
VRTQRSRIGSIGVKRRFLAAGILAGGALASVALAGPTQQVTMEIQRLPDGRTLFLGRIPSGQANEYVTVLARKCGQPSFISFTGTTTEQGGEWHVAAFPTTSAVYRARWNNQLSSPVSIDVKAPVRINLTKEPGNRFRVWLFADSNLTGRFIALQRLAGGRWIHVRRARLASAGAAGTAVRFEATFTVRKRGLRLRIVVPAKTAAPCNAAATTETFRS